MTAQPQTPDYRDRTLILALIGAPLLMAGALVAFLGPVEMYCFYLFSEGGRFHYQGFGFGSFMFGNLAAQIAGYYVAAALLIPLGYGHLRARRWARPLALALLRFWIVAGIPLVIAFLFVLLSSKELSLPTAMAATAVAGASYLVLPWLLIRFYESVDVRLTFERRDPRPHWIEALPVPILALAGLYALYLIVLHLLILFNGLFPLFGTWVTGLRGIVLLAISIWSLAGLAWGTLARQRWAWWGGLLYVGLTALSWVLTLVGSSWLDLLGQMNFPPLEVEILRNVPLRGAHMAVLVAIPLLLTLGLLVRARGCFGPTRV